MRRANGTVFALTDAGTQIEIQDVDLVGAEVDAEQVLRLQVREDLVRVRTFLPRRIGPVPLPTPWKSAVFGADRSVRAEIRKTGKLPVP